MDNPKEQIKHLLLGLCDDVKVRKRPVSGGHRYYTNLSGESDFLRNGHSHIHTLIMPRLKKVWPNARITSGSFGQGFFDVTVALVK